MATDLRAESLPAPEQPEQIRHFDSIRFSADSEHLQSSECVKFQHDHENGILWIARKSKDGGDPDNLIYTAYKQDGGLWKPTDTEIVCNATIIAGSYTFGTFENRPAFLSVSGNKLSILSKYRTEEITVCSSLFRSNSLLLPNVRTFMKNGVFVGDGDYFRVKQELRTTLLKLVKTIPTSSEADLKRFFISDLR